MRVELFAFQKRAVASLLDQTAAAQREYGNTGEPQVVSLQAPTGAGKTVITAAFIENVFFGSESYVEQPDAVFVWLSDSPALNEQSRQKLAEMTSRLRPYQFVTVSDESFDMEDLEDGHIYFLNTQKLGKSGNLGTHSDRRNYTIWETLENTVRNKGDRLCFIIDEAHRGAQGNEAAKATTIMQRFIKGSADHGLSPMPLVIGMSATAERFNRLAGNASSVLRKVVVPVQDVRNSGLLKDRIIVTYPGNAEKDNDMAILQAAADEWLDKCAHWRQYSYEQHNAQVNPVFVVQVQAGSGNSVSATNLDDVIAKVEERQGEHFKEHEVAHTFGSYGTLTVNGLPVHRVEPSEIDGDKRIRLVLFKESLSTGWDCPHAESMMSFCRREDATYIAQLLGRMVRTPLHARILSDESLNEVRLFLPYFDKETVKNVVDALKDTEAGAIPTDIVGEEIGKSQYVTWTVRSHPVRDVPGQENLFGPSNRSAPVNGESGGQGADTPERPAGASSVREPQSPAPSHVTNTPPGAVAAAEQEPQPPVPSHVSNPNPAAVPAAAKKPSEPAKHDTASVQMTFSVVFDRAAVIKFINEEACLSTYKIKSVRISSYLKSLLDLASLLTITGTYPPAQEEVENDVIAKMRAYAERLRTEGRYDGLAEKVRRFELLMDVYDVWGEKKVASRGFNIFADSDEDLERQLRVADAKLCKYGFPNKYGKRYYDTDNSDGYKIDVILYVANDECRGDLNAYAEQKFHALNDT